MPARTFSQKVLNFYDNLQLPETEGFGVEVINPHSESITKHCVNTFYETFYNDTKKRTFIFGINPGRFGSGVTGVPFTDPVALETYCGIKNDLQKRKELSSEFVYTCIGAFGGPKTFFKNFYLTAISPVGFTKNDVNYNYYDDRDFYKHLRSFLIRTIKDQVDFGASRDDVIVFGSGKNLKIFEEINTELRLFKNIYPLEHPRYIMQYKRKEKDLYIKKYLKTFSQTSPR